MQNSPMQWKALPTIVLPTCRVRSLGRPQGLLTNATLPYAIEIANKGWKKAMQDNKEIRLGANVIKGQGTYKAVADAFSLNYKPVEEFI